nr:MAG TPA: hypothetical protein [Caudoviricetes sp.]
MKVYSYWFKSVCYKYADLRMGKVRAYSLDFRVESSLNFNWCE